METLRRRLAVNNRNPRIGVAESRQGSHGANSNARAEPRESEARMKCPKCGHTFKSKNQIKGGKARWSGMSKAHRKQAASDAAKARWAKAKGVEV